MMRVSSTMMTNNYLKQLNGTYNQYTKLMEQSDGDRLHRASDDSVGYSKLLRYENSQAGNLQYQSNVSTALSWMKNSDSVLINVTENLKTFNAKVVQASNSTNNESDCKDIAKELMSLIQETVHEMNTQMGERYLFSGQSDMVMPFALSDSKMERGLAKTLSDQQTSYFGPTLGDTGSMNQFLTLDGKFEADDNTYTYYYNTYDGSVYSYDFMEYGYKSNMAAGIPIVRAEDKVCNIGKMDDSDPSHTMRDLFDKNGVITSDGRDWKMNVDSSGKDILVDGKKLTLSFAKVQQYIVNYDGDDKYISMVTENGAINPSADTVNQTGQDVFGSDIFDAGEAHKSGTAVLNDLLAVVAKVEAADYNWASQNGITVADKAHSVVLGAETTMAARNQAYQATQTMLLTQNESITSDITEVASTDIGWLATKLMEYQTIYSLSLSVGGKTLPGTLADYL